MSAWPRMLRFYQTQWRLIQAASEWYPPGRISVEFSLVLVPQGEEQISAPPLHFLWRGGRGGVGDDGDSSGCRSQGAKPPQKKNSFWPTLQPEDFSLPSVSPIPYQFVASIKDGSQYPVLTIQSKALKHNLRTLQRLSSTERVLIPVKANAYGLGIREILPALEELNVEALGVANPYEAIEIRKLGWNGQVLNLGGFFEKDAGLFFQNQIIPSIVEVRQIGMLGSYNQKIQVHLKFDFGMGRIGLLPSSLMDVASELSRNPNVEVAGIYTHFPRANEPQHPQTMSLLQNFLKFIPSALSTLELSRESVTIHSANSYAAALVPGAGLDMIRPGILFYGYFQSLADKLQWEAKVPIEPSLELEAEAISVRILRPGDMISYGSTYTVSDDPFYSWVVPIGYGDGIPVALSNSISFDGHPLRGRVTMDQIILQGDSPKPPTIHILGETSPPLEKWAELAKTHSYEVLTGLGKRLRRVLV